MEVLGFLYHSAFLQLESHAFNLGSTCCTATAPHCI